LDNVSGFINDVTTVGAYRTCIDEIYQMDIIMFSLLNVITLIAMMYLQKKGKYKESDRGINILFLMNVFALTANIVIAMGLKFYPA